MRRPRLGFVSGVIAISLTCCDIVSGLDDFVTTEGTGTEGGAGATGGAGGAGAMGGGGSGGSDSGCDVDCLGGECVDGACTPVVLVTGQPEVVGVGVTETHVYWTTGSDSRVLRQPLDGGPIEEIEDATTGHLGYLDIHQGRVYWTNQDAGELLSANLDGSGRQVVQSSLNAPLGVEVGNSRILLTEYFDTGDLIDIPFGGGGPSVVVVDLGSPEEVARLPMSHVYWTENATGVIGRFTAGTMTVQHIRTGEGQPSGIDVDATHVYWCTESPGAVKRMSLDGEDVEILAVSPQPTGIVVTDDAVVWGDFTAGTISRLAK